MAETGLSGSGVADPPDPGAPGEGTPDRPVHNPGLLGLLVVDGLLLGGVGLVLTPMYVGAVPAPVGAVLSILVLPWLVLRAGELDPRPGMAGAPLLAWLVAVGMLGFSGPGGDVLLPATWQSLLLLFGGLFAGLLALRTVLVRGPARDTQRPDERPFGVS